MTTKAYVERIVECVNLMVREGVVTSVEELQIKYGLPALNTDVLNGESEESINKIIETLSEKNPAMKVYIQTGARSKIIDKNQVQIGRGNLVGNKNETKESNLEEDCCVKLERAVIEIKYLKKALEDKEKEISQKIEDKDKEIDRLNSLITELLIKIK